MTYFEIEPSGFLLNFIKCFWYYENNDIETVHTILPDGYFDLIAEFENDSLTKVKLTGIWTKPKNVLIAKRTKIFAIRFKLLAIEYLFNNEIKSILDSAQSLSLDFWAFDQYKHNEFEKFTTETTARLLLQLDQLKDIDYRKIKLFELVYKQKIDTVSILSNHLFWSSRQMNRYFQSKYGIPLKEFLSIVRCNASYKEIANGVISPQLSYFDQAHFIKEIKKYTGVTPKELRKNQNDRFLQLSRTEEN
jgi:AraC-like DNA-binding protein